VIRSNCFSRVCDITIGQPAKMLNERRLIFRVVDHAAIQRRTCAILACLGKLVKGVVGRACSAAKYARFAVPHEGVITVFSEKEVVKA
jgi:hypothetical protein